MYGVCECYEMIAEVLFLTTKIDVIAFVRDKSGICESALSRVENETRAI